MLDLMSMTVGLVGGAATTCLGAYLNYVLQQRYERIKGAKLKLSEELIIEPNRNSARVSIVVTHEDGSLPATNAMGFLTVIAKTKPLSEIAARKVDGKCELESLCNLCGGKTYLASSKVEIRSEALPWSLPIEAGTGLEGLKYAHLTHIPVRGLARLRLFDVYRVRVYDYAGGLKDEFWLIKVHSEYGVTHYPRICLKLPMSGSTELALNVTSTGENVRKSAQGEIEIASKDGECIVKYGGEEHRLREYFERNNVEPLELRPKSRLLRG